VKGETARDFFFGRNGNRPLSRGGVRREVRRIVAGARGKRRAMALIKRNCAISEGGMTIPLSRKGDKEA